MKRENLSSYEKDILDAYNVAQEIKEQLEKEDLNFNQASGINHYVGIQTGTEIDVYIKEFADLMGSMDKDMYWYACNALKYVCRAPRKKGVEDIYKAVDQVRFNYRRVEAVNAKLAATGHKSRTFSRSRVNAHKAIDLIDRVCKDFSYSDEQDAAIAAVIMFNITGCKVLYHETIGALEKAAINLAKHCH